MNMYTVIRIGTRDHWCECFPIAHPDDFHRRPVETCAVADQDDDPIEEDPTAEDADAASPSADGAASPEYY